MSDNSKTRETRLNGPVVDREARGEIPKSAINTGHSNKWYILPEGSARTPLNREDVKEM